MRQSRRSTVVALAAVTVAVFAVMMFRRRTERFAPPKLTAKPGVEYTAADSNEFLRDTQIPGWNAKWVMWDAQHRKSAL